MLHEYQAHEGNVSLFVSPDMMSMAKKFEVILNGVSVKVGHIFNEHFLHSLHESGDASKVVAKQLSRDVANYVAAHVEKQILKILAQNEKQMFSAQPPKPLFLDASYSVTPYYGDDDDSETMAFIREIKRLFPNVTQTVTYPCGCHTKHLPSQIYHVVIHLNDHCNWTREQIADWIETLDVDLTLNTHPPASGPDQALIAENLAKGLVLDTDKLQEFIQELKKDADKPAQAATTPTSNSKFDGLDALKYAAMQFPVVNDPTKFGNINPT